MNVPQSSTHDKEPNQILSKRRPSAAGSEHQPVSVQQEIRDFPQQYPTLPTIPFPAYFPDLTVSPICSDNQQIAAYQSICPVPDNVLFLMPPLTTRFPPEWYISALLTRLGFSARLRGFRYIVKALFYLLCRPDKSHCSMGELYTEIARQCQETPMAIERAIRHAIGQMWQGNNIAAYCAMQGRCVAPYEQRPVNGDFLYSLLVFLRMQMARVSEKS